MKPFISIIVPMYNVEKYLADCLDSILEQTYHDYELILINDGSTDCTLEIAEGYAKKYPEKIFLHTKENAGPGLARNMGIKQAKGEYLLFIDSDDVVDSTMLEELYESAYILDSDIVFCPYFRHGLYQEITIEGSFNLDSDKVYTGADFLDKTDYTVTTCSKLYRTEFIRQFLFPDHWFEDVAWLPVVMSYAQKISYVPTAFYHYLRHESSIVSSISDKQILGSLDAIRHVIAHSNPELAASVAPYTANLLLYMCTRRPAFADRYVSLLLEYKAYIMENTDFKEHPRLKLRLDYYYEDFKAIPKCIFYDHFGKVPLTAQEQQNIDEWVGNLVEFDAQIICLDETNCDVSEHPAIQKAYDEGRYDIVGQYFKCKRLLEQGGIALSRQVCGVKYITPLLLRTRAIFGFQNDTCITERIYASVAGHPALEAIQTLFLKHIDSDDAMTKAMTEYLVQTLDITYSYDLECNFKQKYKISEDMQLRVYATCVLAYDYGIRTAYTDCYTATPEKTEKDGREYTLVDSFYYNTLTRITKDYILYQMDRERQNKANESYTLQKIIGRLRKRLHFQSMRIAILQNRCESGARNLNAITRMKLIWYPYVLLRKLFPAKDLLKWNKEQENNKQLEYFRNKMWKNKPEEEENKFS